MTVPTQSFAAQLGTHQDPRAIASGLGHHVGLEAPHGLVLGIAQPSTRTDGPELVSRTRPVQRVSAQPSFEHRTSAEPAAVFEEHEVSVPAPAAASEAPLAQPVRHLPVVQREPIASQPLTTVAPDYDPTPLPASTEVVLAANEPAEEPATDESEPSLPPMPRLTLGQARRLGLGAPLSRVPDTSVQRAADRSAPSAAVPTPVASPPVQAAPVAETPPWEPIFPMDFPTPKRTLAPAPISRPQRIPRPMPLERAAPGAAAHESGHVEALSPGPADGGQSAPAPSASPGEPVHRDGPPESVEDQRPSEALQTDQRNPVTSSGAEAPASPASPGAAEAITVARLVGPPDLALRDFRTIEPNEPAKGEAEGMGGTAPPSLPLAGPTVSRLRAAGSDATRLPTAGLTSAAAAAARPTLAPLLSARQPITTSIQRSPEGAASSPISSVERSIPGGLGGPRVYRTADTSTASTPLSPDAYAGGDGSDQPDSHEGAPLPLQRAEAGRRTESPPLSLARSVAAAAPLTLAPLALARPEAHTSQTSTAVLEAPPPPTMTWSMQRVPAHDAEARLSDAPASSTSASQPATGATTAAETDDESRMDDLAGKLYDKIRNRLRNELLIDRERAGFLTDLR